MSSIAPRVKRVRIPAKPLQFQGFLCQIYFRSMYFDNSTGFAYSRRRIEGRSQRFPLEGQVMSGSRSRIVWVGLVFLFVVLTLAPSRPAQGGAITGSKWSSIGPEPDCCFFNGGETGRTTAVAVNPQDPDDIWIGTAGGGVWHFSGGKWFAMSDDQASLAIGSIALTGCTSAGCAKIYAGTGENAIRRDTYYGAGLLEGTIAGNSVSWTLHKGQAGPPAYDFTHGSIYNVVLDPTTSGASQVIYITMSSGVTASASESTVTAPPPLGSYGIYKSSDDGNTWTKLVVPGSLSLLNPGGRPTDLEMDKTSTGTLYAGFLGRGIFKSLDGGADWCPLTPGIPKPKGCPMTYGLPAQPAQFDHVEIDIYRGDHNHLYASFGNCPDRLVADCEPSIYESTNAGLNWTARYIGSTSATTFGDLTCPRAYTRYMHGLTISPTNPGTVYVTGYHLCESDDHGVSWYAIDNNTQGWMLHPDHHAIVFHDVTTTRAYDVNDGGVALSSDGGSNWTPSTNGLNAFEFQSLATSPDTQQIFGGTQDNSGTAWWPGTKKWKNLKCCGDGGFAAYETYNFGGFFNKTNMYITTNMNGLSNLTILPIKSENGGGTWLYPGVPPASFDLGLNDTESRSFYPPLVIAGGYEMFATDRLYTSVDQLYHWTQRSPQLSSDPESEIFSLADAITAIAVAPSNPSRWYLGYYSGKIFYTNAACSTLSCWTQVSNPSGSAPVTWLAVDPTSPDTVYATVSGFAPGIHVFKTTNAGTIWNPTGSLAELSGVPANTITIDPGASNTLYLGTDHGIYRSDTFGGLWNRFSDGLPNVPVYAITPDASRNLLFAATHGRGAYLLSSFVIGRTLVDGPIRVGPEIKYNGVLTGSKFLPNQSCLVKVLRQDGSVCASGRTDALGGTIQTDAEGNLGATKANLYTDMPVVWACAQGNCLGTDVRKCIQGTQGPADVEVNCGGGVNVSRAPGPPNTPNPPSSLFTIGEANPRPIGMGGMFELVPAVQTGDGASQVFCSPTVPFAPGDTQGMILQHAMDMVNSDPDCMRAGVQAVVQAPQTGGEVEDQFAQSGHLSLAAPNITGGKLIAGLKIVPGQAMGTCFSAGDLDDLMRGRIRSMKIQFATGPGGATGGPIRIREQSMLGQCDISVPAPAGATASGVAAAVAAAFQAPGIPSPYPNCPIQNNPRDLYAAGDAVRTELATDLVICLNDPGIGVSVLPTEVCTTNADCDDGNPCTLDACDPASGQCHSTPAPDGQQCDDANPCTVGNICQSGVCGTPVACNDGNPCTTDACDPATGACTFTTLSCDDGNPCTTDTCSPATGGCVFTPVAAGTACNDGDPCTTGDTCVQIPSSANPICQGTPKCADGDPCTADACDPATGACVNTPIVCDDANPCTLDSCQNGTCVYTPVAGIACDDGDLCTTGDFCVPRSVGNPICRGTPVNCDDGDACTLDSCEPTTGGCRHIPIGLAEVPTGLHFTSATTLTWPSVDGASFYNTYRGTIPSRMLGSRPPAAPLYDQACFEFGDANGDGALISTDAASPPLGTAFYYLVSEETSCGESAIGSDWNGTLIPNSSPCSNPAPPSLSIVKSHSGNFTQGQSGATYTVVVSNLGPGPTFGTVTVTDVVPAGLTLVSMAGPGWACVSNNCSRSDPLGPGAGYPPITVTVDVAATASSPQVNQAGVSGGGSSSAFSNDSTTIVPLTPVLSITKTHTGHFYLGQPDATYKVTVSNTGNAPTSGTVTVTDTPPAGISVASMTGTGWTCPAPGSTCTRSDALAAGSSYPDITVAVNVTAPTSSSETNQATVSGGGSPSASANDPTLIDLPLLAITKSHTGHFFQGQTNATYTLSVQNQGFGPTLGTVTVTEVPPAGLSLVSMSGTGWTCPSPGSSCTRSDVLASAAFYPAITVTVNVASNAPSSVTNQAQDSGGGSIGTGAAFDTTQIDPAAPVLAITKTHIGNFTQGQTNATYTVTVSNTGNAPTSGTVTVTETVPSGLTLVSMAGTGWTCPSPGNTCSRNDALAAGASYPPITVTVNVSATASSPR